MSEEMRQAFLKGSAKVNDTKESEEEGVLALKSSVFIGQKEILEKVDLLIKKVTASNKPLPHILFVGEDGMGKGTLAAIIARKLNSRVTVGCGGSIERLGDLIGILTILEDKDIFLIKDIDELKKTVAEFLIPALHSLRVEFVIDKGPYARKVIFNLKKFTCIATTSQPNKLKQDNKTFYISHYDPDS